LGKIMGLSATPRSNMSKGQLLACCVRDERVLEAVAAVKREDFVPAAFASSAYVDAEIPLSAGRFLMEPLVFCRMLELAEIKPTDKVLDIGCGFGYSTAVLAHLAKKVVALEENPELASEAYERLARHSKQNIEIITSSLLGGVATQQPFDVIMVGGAVQIIPEKLLEQLAEGGRLVTVENTSVRPGECSGLGTMLKIIRHGGKFDRIIGLDASVPILPGFEKRHSFEF
jgi:protein-L-isoaspartate(D-aspartate) O-methyltransferase